MLLEGDAVTLEDNGSVSWISTSWHAFINFGDLMPKNSIRDVFARERPGITRKLRASQRARSQEGTEKILEVYLFEFSTTDFIDLPIHLSCLHRYPLLTSGTFYALILSFMFLPSLL